MSVDFAEPEPLADPVADSLAQTWRGLPLNHSKRALLAAHRYGLKCMALTEDDIAENGTYPGMADDACITVLCALCAADAGKDPDCPPAARALLRVRTLNRSRAQLADALGEMVDAFDVDPLTDEETYTVGQDLILTGNQSEVSLDDDAAPGKPEPEQGEDTD